MISLNSVSMQYGPQVLFKDASVQMKPGKRYGIVGANGAGKSTMLRLIHGKEEASGGNLSIPKDYSIGVLEQDHFKYEEWPIQNVVLSGKARLWELLQEKEKIAAHETENGDRLAELEDELAMEEAYDAPNQVERILAGLGIPKKDINNPLSSLSGGFKLRVLLAKVLFSNPNVLLLDEPTNHLDIVSINWLEGFLTNSFEGIVVVVSHDREFLNRICTHIVDIDFQKVITYTGGYESFLQQKELLIRQNEKEVEQKEKKIQEMQAFVDRFRYKATKARQAQSRVKQIEKIDLPEIIRTSRRYPNLRFEQIRPSAKRVLKAEGISKAYGDHQVLTDVDFEVMRGERIAILGANGLGKSTLINILTDRLGKDAGDYEWGVETSISYFSQDHKELAGLKASLMDWLFEQKPEFTIGQIRSVLAQVLFSQDDVHKACENLSGGEKARLLLAKIMADKHNVIVLDEPTNHLDLEATESLESALCSFEGTILFVSHDKHFVRNVANRIYELTPTGLNRFESYDDYEKTFADKSDLTFRADKKVSTSDEGLSYNDRKALNRKKQKAEKESVKLEATIADLEKEQAAVLDQFAQPGTYDDAVLVLELEDKKKAIESKLEAAMSAWEKSQQILEEANRKLGAE